MAAPWSETLNSTEVYVSRTPRKLRVYIWISDAVSRQHVDAGERPFFVRRFSGILASIRNFVHVFYFPLSADAS